MNHRLAIPAILAVLAASEQALGQVMRQKVVGSGLQQTDEFGSATAVSGDWAVVGAVGADDLGSNSGAAYVFEFVGGAWIERQRLKASDAATNAGFGYSIGIEGSTIAIGSPGRNYQGIQKVGAVYVFELLGGVWTETQALIPNDAAVNYTLGCSLAFSGGRIISGANGEWHAGPHTGAAYIFESVGGSWSQVAKVIANDGAGGDNFGYSVAVHGNVAVVGAIEQPNGTINYVGAVYVYELQGSQWTQAQKLTPPNPSGYQRYGRSLGANADSILVCADNNPYFLPTGGATFVYQHPGSTWDQTQVLAPGDLDSLDFFGGSVAVSGNHAVIGSYSADLPQARGAHYIFTEVGSTWMQTGKCIAPDMIDGDGMGNWGAIDDRTILAGAPTSDGACPTIPACNSGSAYFFEFAPGSAQYGSGVTGCPCSNNDGHGGCVNSTGQGAVLATCGTNSVSADDLVLEGRWLPPSVNAVAFMGQGTGSFLLGDGLRVVTPRSGSGVYRLPVHQASNGVVTYGPGLVASALSHPLAGQIQPGQTWNFQIWYRDVGGSCGSGSNTTNGVSVAFAP